MSDDGFVALSTSAMAPTRLFRRTASRSARHGMTLLARADRTRFILSRSGAGARDHIELWDGLWDFLRLWIYRLDIALIAADALSAGRIPSYILNEAVYIRAFGYRARRTPCTNSLVLLLSNRIAPIDRHPSASSHDLPRFPFWEDRTPR
jgi:hypothetical protein